MSALVLQLALADSLPAQEYVYDSSFGDYGYGAGLFTYVTDVAQDHDGHLVVVDTNNSIYQVCDYVGNCSQPSTPGTELGEFLQPWSVAVNSENKFFITDQGNGRVQECDHQGNCTAFDTTVPGDDRVLVPHGIAIDKQDRVIITDPDNWRILICGPQGGDCTSTGQGPDNPDPFESPQDVAVDGANRILVADGNRVLVCNHSFNCSSFGEYGDQEGQFIGLYGIAALANGNVAVTENQGRAQVCDYQGNCIAFGATLEVPVPVDKLSVPRGLTEDDLGRLVITDDHLVKFFRPAFTINAGLNDAWLNFDTAGQGVLVTVFPVLGKVFIAIFTFDTERPADDVIAVFGESAHRWVTALGNFSGNQAVLSAELTTGGIFDATAPAPQQTPGYGTITLVFTDCNHLTLTYDFPAAGISGQMQLTRVATDNVPLCESLSGGG